MLERKKNLKKMFHRISFISHLLRIHISFLLRYNLKITSLALPITELRIEATFTKYFQLGTTPLILQPRNRARMYGPPLTDMRAVHACN